MAEKYRRRTQPHIALGTIERPDRPVPLVGVKEVTLDLSFGSFEIPAEMTARIILLDCPRGDRSFPALVDPAARMIRFKITKRTDVAGALTHGRMTFPHPRCPGRPAVRTNELRDLVLTAYRDGLTRATLP